MSFFSKNFSVGNRTVGEGHPCFIIAEAGVSHFGDRHKAFQLVDAAVAAKADAVKFQIFQTEEMISSQEQFWTERMKSRELPFEVFREIQTYCLESGILFFATAHDLKSLDQLATLRPPVYKIGSGEVKNPPYFRAVAKLGKPVIFSTGMYGEEDVRRSLDIFQEENCHEVAVLHCVTSYPVPPENVNLKRMETLKKMFSGPVGYSDHTAYHEIAASSVLLGANVIEKHITLEKNIPNAQDWKVSCDPAELITFVQMIRRFEVILGDGTFSPNSVEQNSLLWARKSVILTRDLPAGSLLASEDLGMKRPGTGISPLDISKVISRRLKVGLPADTLLNFEMLE